MFSTMEKETEMLAKYIRVHYNRQEDFAEALGMTRQNLNYHIRKATNNNGMLSDDFKETLKQKGINIFYTSENKNEINEPPNPYLTHRLNLKNGDKKQYIPVYEGAPVTLTNTQVYRDEKLKADYFIPFIEAIPQLRGCDYVCRAIGDSMHPMIRSGSLVFGKKLQSAASIIMGEVYIVHTVNNQETIKYVHQDSNAECFQLIPYNKKSQVTVIRKEDILNIYEYRGSIFFP